MLPDPAPTWRDDSLTALISRRSWEESRLPNPWPMSEMAAWDPADDDSDAGQAFSEADQRSLLALGLVAALALVLVAASGVLSFISR